MVSFVHLHCHSEYSLLDGANRIDDLIARAKEFEQPALAITDHGNMHAAWEFQEKARKAGIKPLIGMEAYVAPGSRHVKEREGSRKPYYHLVLLANSGREDGVQHVIVSNDVLLHLCGRHSRENRLEWNAIFPIVLPTHRRY